MTNADTPAARLGRLVRARRKELKLTQAEVQAEQGPSTATLRLIENGRHTDFRPSTSAPLERVLHWEPGSIDDILSGGDPTPSQYMAYRGDMKQPRDERSPATEPPNARYLRVRFTPADERTPEDAAWLEEWDAKHPRRPDPGLGVDEDGNWLPVETTFENWLQARNQLSTKVLHYARARGISFKAAEEELPHVQQMAADVANGTDRPWTPPWDPGSEFDDDEEPWKTEFWTYTEAVPSPYGTEGYIYRHGITFDLAEARSNREKSARAAEIWEEDKAKQAGAYYQRRAQPSDPAEDAEFEAWIRRSGSGNAAEPSRLSRLIKWPKGTPGDFTDPTDDRFLDGSLNVAEVTADSVVTETAVPDDILGPPDAASRLRSDVSWPTKAPDRDLQDEAPPDLADAARTAPPGYRSPGQAERDAQDQSAEQNQDPGDGCKA